MQEEKIKEQKKKSKKENKDIKVIEELTNKVKEIE